ncbi:MAG TPA: glycosyltransferase [Thermoanaerobaculia bacterium]|jgi:GT2 family glycosyltransferase|nr:glycosyltransferase [Thermoanaerobaculia bacterium]
MTSVSLLVISYRSSALAADAIATARAASSRPLQVIVVDNSVDSAEADALRTVADIVIASPRNLGYAGGINAGRRLCDGDVIVVSNPDVRFGEQSIDRLVDANAAVAGPALFWDDAHRWMLPPAELHTRREVIDRVLASRSRAWARRRARRRFFERVAFWSLDQTTRVRALSGAVMVIRASAFDGGFDERFPLYFEENDFLRRVKGDVVYVPSARCRHLYNQSAAGSVEAASLYARSELLYLNKWGGAFAKKFEGRLESLVAEGGESGDIILEASPLATFETAAGHFGRDVRDVSEDIWSTYRGHVLYLRAVDLQTARVLRSWTKARITA